eukprot:20231-Rhodomonas_salina.1
MPLPGRGGLAHSSYWYQPTLATRGPVLTGSTMLYLPTPPPMAYPVRKRSLWCYGLSGTDVAGGAMVLEKIAFIFGTDAAYGDLDEALRESTWCYGAMRCAVLRWRMAVLRGRSPTRCAYLDSV